MKKWIWEAIDQGFMTIIEWLKVSSIGILFGIFPLWWWCSAIIIQASEYEGKNVPNWMTFIAKNNPILGLYYINLFRKHYYTLILKSLALLFIIVVVVAVQYLPFIDFQKGRLTIKDLIVAETSFSTFLLATWLLPTYFLTRYLNKR